MLLHVVEGWDLALVEGTRGIVTGTETETGTSTAIETFAMLLVPFEGMTIVPTGLVAMIGHLRSIETDRMLHASAQRLLCALVETRKRV